MSFNIVHYSDLNTNESFNEVDWPGVGYTHFSDREGAISSY